jgi:hypothetical protein
VPTKDYTEWSYVALLVAIILMIVTGSFVVALPLMQSSVLCGGLSCGQESAADFGKNELAHGNERRRPGANEVRNGQRNCARKSVSEYL